MPRDNVTPFITRRQMQDSLAYRDAVRGADEPLPFPLAPGGVVGRPLRLHRHVRPIRPTTIERIYAERGHGPANDDEYDHPTARYIVALIGAATLLVGLLVWFL